MSGRNMKVMSLIIFWLKFLEVNEKFRKVKKIFFWVIKKLWRNFFYFLKLISLEDVANVQMNFDKKNLLVSL